MEALEAPFSAERSKEYAIRKLIERRSSNVVEVIERAVREFTGRSPSDVRSRGPYMEQQVLFACGALQSVPSASACALLVSFLNPIAISLLRARHVSEETKRDVSNVLDMLQSILDTGSVAQFVV